MSMDRNQEDSIKKKHVQELYTNKEHTKRGIIRASMDMMPYYFELKLM
jgi:hypothetical protein